MPQTKRNQIKSLKLLGLFTCCFLFDSHSVKSKQCKRQMSHTRWKKKYFVENLSTTTNTLSFRCVVRWSFTWSRNSFSQFHSTDSCSLVDNSYKNRNKKNVNSNETMMILLGTQHNTLWLHLNENHKQTICISLKQFGSEVIAANQMRKYTLYSMHWHFRWQIPFH